MNALDVLRPRRLLMTTAALDALREKAAASAAKQYEASLEEQRVRNRVMARDVTKTKLVLAPHQIIIRPLVTEKGMHKANRYNAYAFEVNPWPARTTSAGPWKSCST